MEETAAPLDRAHLLTIVGNDPVRALKVLDQYCEATTEDLRQLRECTHHQEMTRFAHRVKGAALMVGAGPLAAIAARLEHAGPGAPADEVQRLITELDHAFARVRACRDAGFGTAGAPTTAADGK